jgi:hypothetical protein
MSITKSKYINKNIDSRQEVVCSGITLLNNSYLPSPEFMSNKNIKKYEVFNTESPSITANQQTFSGVCDKEYVYYAWEVGSKEKENYLKSGTLVKGWGIYHNLLNSNETIIIKQSRDTGEIVLAKRLADITGLPTTDTTKIETTGDDITRGPFAIYDGYLYTTGQSQVYPSIMKIKCSDLSLVWRKVVTDGNQYKYIKGHPSISKSGLLMRQIIVIPPNKHRNYPLVIASSVSALSYCTITLDTLFKLFNYYNGSGKVYAYKDNGSDADFLWDYSSSGKEYLAGDKLSSGSFGNGIDEIKIYYPLTQGYEFKEGDPKKGIEKTSGTFNLLTGNINPDKSWEYGKFKFDPNTVFDNQKDYECIIQNGPNKGKKLIIPGIRLYKKTSDGEEQQYQPVIKILYRTQINKKKLDDFEAYELTMRGGGVYCNFCYEEEKDTIIFGTGNLYHIPYGIIHDSYNKLNGNNNDPYVANNPIVDGETFARVKTGIYQPLPEVVDENVVRETRKRQLNYWTEAIFLRENTNYGTDFNRVFFDSIVGLNCSNGGINFALKTNRVDLVDHSITIGKSQAKVNIFYPNGNNQDVMGVTIATFDNYKIHNKNLSGKYLLACTKARLIIFDYYKLFNKITGVNKNSLNYSEGIIKNTAFNDALIWEQKEGSTDQIGVLRSFAFDGRILIRKSSGNNKGDFSSIEKPNEVYEPGIEVNGFLVSPNIPDPASFLIAYDIPNIIINRPNNYKDAILWAFSNNKIFGAGESGTVAMYGPYSFFGTKSGYLFILNSSNGEVEKILYNEEGFSTCPVIADGLLYGYGGNNKWTPANVKNYSFASKIYMYTPFGE